jgi:hypothetical protein
MGILAGVAEGASGPGDSLFSQGLPQRPQVACHDQRADKVEEHCPATQAVVDVLVQREATLLHLPPRPFFLNVTGHLWQVRVSTGVRSG